MKCEYCGAEFTPLTVNQRYCSGKCGYTYRRKHKDATRRHFPAVTFNCSQCGRAVVTDGIRDRRTRFCSPECEKKYWRHPPHDNPATRTNFKSFAAYATYEKRTNKRV